MPSRVKPISEKAINVSGETIDAGPTLPSFRRVKKKHEYDIISRKNLFNPERTASNKEPIVVVEAATVPMDIKNKIHLYGVVIYGDKETALVQYPPESKDEKPLRWVTKGKKVSEYVIDEIRADKIYLKKGIKRYPIFLYAQNDIKSQRNDTKQREFDKDKMVMKNKPVHFDEDEDEAFRNLKKKEEEVFITPTGKKYRMIDSPSGKRKVIIN